MSGKWMVISLSVLILVLMTLLIGSWIGSSRDVYEAEGVRLVAKTEDRAFLVYRDGKFRESFLKGVNIGATKPGHFPGELAITKEEYLRWFQWIHQMHADVIRVYTTMKPVFYEALYEFNQGKSRPLYLMQGLWKNEDLSKELGHAYANDDEILLTLIEDGKDLVDIFHGKADIPYRQGHAHGTYQKDVSKYVIGWILGVEWDPHFVVETNLVNPQRNQYLGNLIETTEDASPFEAFMVAFGDAILTYELETYGMMRPVSFTNWLTTDPLSHPNEPYVDEDLVSVDTERIKATEKYLSGIFASYHVYPYYPEFINHSIEYRNFIDETGKANPYRAYLRDLFSYHSVPVMVAEFGIPASRGKAHDSVYLGFNQGFMSEEAQGHAVVSMMNDIKKEGYMGGLVFAWQDEWFKRTWNTMDVDVPLRRPFWSNVQTNEQMFGLLSFEPGERQRVSYADGNLSDWTSISPLFETEQISLSIQYDARYLYLMIDLKSMNLDEDTLWIPILTLPDQGNLFLMDSPITFAHPAEFLIEIAPDRAHVLVDAYYDAFYYQYAEVLGMIPKNPLFRQMNSGIFNPIRLALSGPITLPEDNITLPFSSYETGRLKHGIANPSLKGYDSLADYHIKNGKIEMEIPWALLSISDPSTKMHLGSLYTYGFEPIPIEGIRIGAAYQTKSGEAIHIDMHSYTWQTWNMPIYHERLKASYFILKQAFRNL